MASPDGHLPFTFGQFRLHPTERSLEKNGDRIPLGSRAFDLLAILVENNGNIVTKKELTARAWPDTVVDEVSLRVHISAVRKALGNGPNGTSYITNVSGRGYMFSAAASSEAKAAPASGPEVAAPASDLPMPLARMVGRTGNIEEIEELLAETRFVTIVGVGGLGKTTVAVAVAHRLCGNFADGAFFVDLASIGEGRLVASTVAALLGTSVPSHDPLPHLIEFLRGRNLLLVLDNAEHLIDDVAVLAERIIERCGELSILTTSREALRVEGEYVYNLAPLEVPPRGTGAERDALVAYPAVQLFIDRAFANGGRRELDVAEAAVTAEICRRLDGVALAIELVAGRAATHGVSKMLDLLDHRFGIHWQGRRTALPRHQTLSALHDWSYVLLDDAEKLVLRRLGCFSGPFTLVGAAAVIGDDLPVHDIVEALCAKSLVSRIPTADGILRYRLAETTRAYTQEKLRGDHGELSGVMRAHALYHAELLERSAPAHGFHITGLARTGTELLGNIRSALEWCFGEQGNAELALRLTASASPLFLELSLLAECHGWASMAIEILPEEMRGTRHEALVHQALAISGIINRDAQAGIAQAFGRALEIARALNDRLLQLDLLAGYHIFVMRAGDCRTAEQISAEAEAIAAEISDRNAELLVWWLRGVSHSYAGEDGMAIRYFERGCAEDVPGGLDLNLVVFTQKIRAMVQYARCLMRLGSPDRARLVAYRAVETAAEYGHPIPHCIALAYAAEALVWNSDWDEALELAGGLSMISQRHSLSAFKAVSIGIAGEIDVYRGNAARGIEQLRDALGAMRAENHFHMSVSFTAAVAQGLADLGEIREALSALDRAIELAETSGEKFQMPDMLELRRNFCSRPGHGGDTDVRPDIGNVSAADPSPFS